MTTADDDLIHAPLARWASRRPQRPALVLDAHTRNAQTQSFAELQARIGTIAASLGTHKAPGTCLIDSAAPLALPGTLLGTIATGRCAAVADADWPTGIRQRIAACLPQQAHDDGAPILPEAPFYIGFTSGSTGLPKGFRRSHRSWVESFRVTLKDFGSDAAGPILAPGRLTHSLFLFGALFGLWNGAGVFLQTRFSAPGTLHTLRQHAIPVLIAVPGQLQMLIAAARHQQLAPIPSVRLILISGARWTHDDTPALQALFPFARILCFYGASETSYISWMPATEGTSPDTVGRPFSNVQLHIGPDPRQSPLPPGQPGLIWVKSPMIFNDYVNADDSTAATRIGDWISVRDIGHLDEDGMLHLDGRENRMIVSQARNIFPEEIESCLARHPAIAQVSVHGLPDPQRGQGVHVVLCLKPAAPRAAPTPITSATGQPAPGHPPTPPGSALHALKYTGSPISNPAELIAWCRQHLETWKTPRHWWLWQGTWPLTTSGKTDHARIGAALHEHLENKTPILQNSTSMPESKASAQDSLQQAKDPAQANDPDIKPLIKPLQEAMTTP